VLEAGEVGLVDLLLERWVVMMSAASATAVSVAVSSAAALLASAASASMCAELDGCCCDESVD